MGRPLAALAVLLMLYQRLGVILLGMVGAGAAVTGWFAAAARLVEASKIAHYSLSGALLPALGQAALSTHDGRAAADARQALRTTWKTLLVLSLVASLAITILAVPLTRLLFGDGFGPTAGALRVLAWVLIPFTLNAYFSLMYVAAGMERPALIAVGTSIFVFASLGVLWIPLWGLMGVCWAFLIAECSQAAVYLAFRFRAEKPVLIAHSASEV
jgi:O-antigen/teichoic acid export membrane protein